MPVDGSLWKLVTGVRARCAGVVLGLDDSYRLGSFGEVMDTAGVALLDVFNALDDAKTAVDTGSNEVARWLNDPVWVVEERRRRAAAAITTATDESDAAIGRAESLLSALHVRMQRAALPQRPGTPDAAQEARLSGLKADMRMVFDGQPREEIASAFVDTLHRAVDHEDALTVWLLAASDWPDLYLRSRFSDPLEASYNAALLAEQIPKMLAPLDSKPIVEARRVLNLWERGLTPAEKYGLADVITLARFPINDELDVLRGMDTGPGTIPPDWQGGE